MLTTFRGDAKELAEEAIWVDLINPTDEELTAVRQRVDIRVPTQQDLERIEASSRLSARDDVLTMSAPLISGTTTELWDVAPVGFVLTPKIPVTVRFAELEAFDAVRSDLASAGDPTPSKVLVQLLGEVVDRSADHLERASEAINAMSREIFFDKPKRQRLGHDTALLRETMRRIGQISDRVARVRYAFLSMGRIAEFTLDRCDRTVDEQIHDRLESVRADIKSLDEFEDSL